MKLNQPSVPRIYCAKDGNSVVLLLAGGDKSTQPKDIKKAKEYFEEYKKGEKVMANRAKVWDENISKKLKNKSYRQEFFLSLVEEEALSIREAIYTISKTMGNQEFAKLIDMAPSNTSRVTNPKNSIKDSTLTYILKKIGCELTVKTA